MNIGLPGLLTIIFVIAKLAGVINWSWLWVFSPVWIALLVVAAFYVITLGSAAILGFLWRD